MTATILPMPSRRETPDIGDPVICTRDGKPGHVERIVNNKIGRPALAVVRVSGGFGARLLTFEQFERVRRQKRRAV